MSEIKELRRKFDMIDVDGSGEISFQEFKNFLANLFGD